LATSTSRTLFDGLQRWLERTPFIKFGTFDFWDKYRSAVTDMIQDDRESLHAQHWISDEAQTLQSLKLDQTEKLFHSLFDKVSSIERSQPPGRTLVLFMHTAFHFHHFRYLLLLLFLF